MEFQVGDKLYHPLQGAGELRAIEQSDLVDTLRRYYVIEMVGGKTTLRVPVRRAVDLGLRYALRPNELEQIWQILRDPPQPLEADHRVRQSVVRDLLRGGGCREIAAMIRDLHGRAQVGQLTRVDQRLFDQAVELLAGELALVTDRDPRDVEQAILQALTGQSTVDGALA